MAYAALDYYGIDELFTHEERMVRDTVRELVTSRVMPTIGKHWSRRARSRTSWSRCSASWACSGRR